jgi:hypothetical protein
MPRSLLAGNRRFTSTPFAHSSERFITRCADDDLKACQLTFEQARLGFGRQEPPLESP